MCVIKQKENGFSLLELLLVVGILAIIASIGIYSFEGRRGDAQNTAAMAEMQQLRQALLNYHSDNFEFPKATEFPRKSPADLSFLFIKNGQGDWDYDYQTGWRGPYLASGDAGLLSVVGSKLSPSLLDDYNDESGYFTGSEEVKTEDLTDIYIVPSPYFDNKHIANNNRNSALSPLLVFALNDKDNARIVNMGNNGLYDSSDIDSCDTDEITDETKVKDDLILCLFK